MSVLPGPGAEQAVASLDVELLYAGVKAVAKATFSALDWRVYLEHAKGVPATGAAVLVANHLSWVDPVLLGYAADVHRRNIRFLTMSELWESRWAGRALDRMRHIPVHPGEQRKHTTARAAALLREGELVAVFPEGGIRPAFSPTHARPGAAQMALASGAPIVPVGVWGGQYALPPVPRTRPRRHVAVVACVGEALSPDEPDPDRLTRRLMASIGCQVERAERAWRSIS